MHSQGLEPRQPGSSIRALLSYLSWLLRGTHVLCKARVSNILGVGYREPYPILDGQVAALIGGLDTVAWPLRNKFRMV
jgi:hypothetical protein